MGKLYEELKRRKVFRVAVVYAVVAWVLIQVADTVLPALQMPEWTVSFVTVLFILGFIPTLVAAWAYEITPEGIKSDSASQSQAQIPAPQNQGLVYATFILVLLVASFQVADRFIFGDQQQDQASSGIAALNPDNTRVLRSSILLGQVLPQAVNPPIRSVFEISTDGSMFYYLNMEQLQGGQLFVRNLATGNTQLLGESPNAGPPRISPDGRRLTTGGSATTLKILDLQSSSWQSIALNKRPGPVEWLSDDEVLYPTYEQTLRSFSLSTGEDRSVTQVTENSQSHGDARMLPGGEAFLYSVSSLQYGVGDYSIEVYDLVQGSSKTLISNGYSPRYAASGHLIFARSGDLFAVQFDLESLQTIGSEVRVVEGVSSQQLLGVSTYTISASGRLVYLPGKEIELGQTGFVWEDRFGNSEEIGLPLGSYADPELSPDGRSLALSFYDDDASDIWVFDLSRKTFGRRTFTGLARNPKWTPDGTRLVYTVTNQGIWSINADGTGQPQQITAEATARPDSFTGNGDELIYLTGVINNAKVNRLSNRDSSWLSSPLMHDQVNTWGAVVSPDGRWISYVSDETGEQEIYVRPYPDVDDGKWQISTDGGREPLWGANGDELYFVQFDGTLLSVTIDTERGFEPGVPQILLEDFAINGADPPSYDVSNDGQRFLRYPSVIEPEASELITAQGNAVLEVVENWFEELRRLAPLDPQ